MHVHIETEIDRPAEHVWQILAHRFGEIAAWSSTVTASEALAARDLPPDLAVDPRAPVAGRRTTSAFATLREYFTAFDDDARTFTFATLDLPLFLTRAENTSRVEALGPERSRVVFDVEMDFWGPFVLASGLMRARFTRAMHAVHADLRQHAEGAG